MAQPETSFRIARMVFVSPSCENITPEEEEILEELEEGVAGFRFLFVGQFFHYSQPARGTGVAFAPTSCGVAFAPTQGGGRGECDPGVGANVTPAFCVGGAIVSEPS